MTFPTITAHTGCEHTPDNTHESSLAGIELGADCVEVDVRSTVDGVLVLSHDDAVQAGGGRWISISESKASDLASGYSRVERLAPVFNEVIKRGKCINLDLKDDASTEPVAALVARSKSFDQVVITGCEIKRAAHMAAKDRRMQVFLNTVVPPMASLPIVGRLTAKRLCEKAVRSGCCGLNINFRYMSRNIVDVAHEHKLLVSVWTVGEDDGFSLYIEAGVDNITTRDVSALVSFRNSMGSMP